MKFRYVDLGSKTQIVMGKPVPKGRVIYDTCSEVFYLLSDAKNMNAYTFLILLLGGVLAKPLIVLNRVVNAIIRKLLSMEHVWQPIWLIYAALIVAAAAIIAGGIRLYFYISQRSLHCEKTIPAENAYVQELVQLHKKTLRILSMVNIVLLALLVLSIVLGIVFSKSYLLTAAMDFVWLLALSEASMNRKNVSKAIRKAEEYYSETP